jgi:6-phosphogluconolactonase
LFGVSVVREVRILADAAAVAKHAAEELLEAAKAAKKSFALVLSGGSTPKTLYALLAGDPMLRTEFPWDKITLYFGDERHVGPDHPDSNFRMVKESLLALAPLKPEQVRRIKAEQGDAERAALEYQQIIRADFGLRGGQFPRFDVVLLGMGSDGHTASLFPGTKALRQTRRIVASNWVGKLYAQRITLTAPAINNAAQVIFLVTGADKAPALKGVLEGPREPEQLPAQMIEPRRGQLLWLVDRAAGSMLSTGIRE